MTVGKYLRWALDLCGPGHRLIGANKGDKVLSVGWVLSRRRPGKGGKERHLKVQKECDELMRLDKDSRTHIDLPTPIKDIPIYIYKKFSNALYVLPDPKYASAQL